MYYFLDLNGVPREFLLYDFLDFLVALRIPLPRRGASRAISFSSSGVNLFKNSKKCSLNSLRNSLNSSESLDFFAGALLFGGATLGLYSFLAFISHTAQFHDIFLFAICAFTKSVYWVILYCNIRYFLKKIVRW